MTKEEIVQGLYKGDSRAIKEAIKALEQQKPIEKFENAKDHICKLAGDYKCWDNRLSHEESLELYNILEQQSDDCVSRQAVDELCFKFLKPNNDDNMAFYEHFCDLPPVSSTHGTCKDCKHWKDSDGEYRRGIYAESKCPINNSRVFEGTFYCADFEKRGNENVSS